MDDRQKGIENMIRNDNEFQGFFAEFFDRLHEDCGDAESWPVLLKPYGRKNPDPAGKSRLSGNRN